MKHCKFLNTALDRLTFHQQGITEPFGFLVLDSRKTLKNLQLCVSYSRIAALVLLIFGECFGTNFIRFLVW